MAKVLTSQADDFPRWYQDVVAKAELADNGPVRGTMVIRPWGYAMWELVQRALDDRIKAAGAKNAYFPLFIPESYLRKEAEHVEGFAPELAIVTHGGGEELAEPVVVRPTSETIINTYFSKWVQSHRDLPLLINQWANVVRWELRPRLFLRTTEFLWQEGHTCHASQEEAHEYAVRILDDVYSDTLTNVMGIPQIVGRKTDREKFAGADATFTCEGIMRDGKALQLCTSHELGQNFAKVFDTSYQDPATNQPTFVWQTSWGFTTRSIGAMIMVHGDDDGLRVPPAMAPSHVVVIAVRDDEAVLAECRRLGAELVAAGLRVEVDDRTGTSFGRRSTDWELKGVPVRVEVGPRDLAEGKVTVARRVGGTKDPAPLSSVVDAVKAALDLAQSDLLAEARLLVASSTVAVESLTDALEAARSGMAKVPWDAVRDADATGKLGDGVTVRCLQRADGSLPASQDEPDLVAYLARAY
jgi:prolyl-tRNA synthetase